MEGKIDKRGDSVNLLADMVTTEVVIARPAPPAVETPPAAPEAFSPDDEDFIPPPPDEEEPWDILPPEPPSEPEDVLMPPPPTPSQEREAVPAGTPTRAPSPERYQAPVFVGPREVRERTAADLDRPREIRVVLKRTGNLEEDRRRLAEVCDLFGRYRGRDHFYLIIPQNGGWVEIEFPNTPTGWCESLEAELMALEGVESVDVR